MSIHPMFACIVWSERIFMFIPFSLSPQPYTLCRTNEFKEGSLISSTLNDQERRDRGNEIFNPISFSLTQCFRRISFLVWHTVRFGVCMDWIESALVCCQTLAILWLRDRHHIGYDKDKHACITEDKTVHTLRNINKPKKRRPT